MLILQGKKVISIIFLKLALKYNEYCRIIECIIYSLKVPLNCIVNIEAL